MNNIRIKQYEQTADEKVSFNGIKWLRKWDVCVQCDSAEEAEALRARLAQPEQELVVKLKELLEVQGRDCTWNYDPYFHGMYNGMEVMLAVLENR